jgi:hypothetical protein
MTDENSAANRPSPAVGRASAGGMAVAGVCGCEPYGTCTIVLHCGHDARLPAADAGTFSARPQPVQWNSIVSEEAVLGWDMIAGNVECRKSNVEGMTKHEWRMCSSTFVL